MSDFAIRPITTPDTNAFGLPPLTDGAIGWVYLTATPVAILAFYPLPGLPHIADLYLFTKPAFRKRGIATALLTHAWGALPQSSITEISASVDSPTTAEARFLLARGFQRGHVEWEMTLHKPPISAETTPQLRQYPRETTVSTFRALYDDAFHAHPWYQPWLSDDEVRDDLQADDSILFWEHEGAPVGFVWVRRPKRYVADLEPVGVIPAYQGQGFGRKLLAASLDFLAREGIGKVRLGVWSENQRAIALYQSFGFRQTGSHYYLVREIGGE